jgi:hypothetical protein
MGLIICKYRSLVDTAQIGVSLIQADILKIPLLKFKLCNSSAIPLVPLNNYAIGNSSSSLSPFNSNSNSN